MIDFFGSHTKEVLHVYYGEEKSQIQTYFDSQSHLTHNENKCVETSVLKFCGIFFHSFRDFSRIFDKSKLLGVRLYPPCIAAPYTTV